MKRKIAMMILLAILTAAVTACGKEVENEGIGVAKEVTEEIEEGSIQKYKKL